MREGRPVAVGAKGLSLLCALLQAPGQVLGKSALMEAAWSGSIVEESNLTVQIAALRKLLGPPAGWQRLDRDGAKGWLSLQRKCPVH